MSDGKTEAALPIRQARADDYDGIVALWRASGLEVRLKGRDSEPEYRRQLEQTPDLFLVATDADRIVGVVFGSHDYRKGWINHLAVLPDYRRRGLAVALVTECEAAIASHGIEIFAALVEPDHPESHALFESLGYKTDVPVDYYRKLSNPDV